jgi:hypothetical protein
MCSDNIELLRSDSISIFEHIPALQPLSKIYRAAKSQFDEAQTDRKAELHEDCVQRTEQTLEVTKRYVSR